MTTKLPGINACVFDAYGTLFDVNSAARTAQDALGEKWQPLAELWRTKQLQYTWLRGLAGPRGFLAGDGRCPRFRPLDAAIGRPGAARAAMNLYMVLSAYPEVPGTLKELKAAGMKLAILSNGTPAMLAPPQPTRASPICSTRFCRSKR